MSEDPKPDPAAANDLRLMPVEDLRDWLRIERNAVSDYLVSAKGSAERARWASSRVKRLEQELRRRSGRISPPAP